MGGGDTIAGRVTMQRWGVNGGEMKRNAKVEVSCVLLRVWKKSELGAPLATTLSKVRGRMVAVASCQALSPSSSFLPTSNLLPPIYLGYHSLKANMPIVTCRRGRQCTHSIPRRTRPNHRIIPESSKEYQVEVRLAGLPLHQLDLRLFTCILGV